MTELIRQSRLPVAFILLLLAYFLVQSLSFSAFKSGADIDTTELMMYNQFWSLGYWGSQPPLYNWLTHLAADIFGTSVFVYAAVKFMLLFLAFACVYLSARELGFRTGPAIASTLGIFAVPEIAWEAQRALSHSAAVNAFCAMSLFAFVRLRNHRRIADYGFFGLAAAAAVLSKYNGVLFVAALLLAALTIGSFSRPIRDRKIVVSAVVFGAAILPHLLWVLANLDIVFHRQIKFGIGDGIASAGDRLSAFLSWAGSTVLTSAVVMVAVGAAFVVDRFRGRAWTVEIGDASRLLVCLILIFQLVLLGMLLVFGATRMENRWLQPVLLILPLTVLALFGSGPRPASSEEPIGNPGLTRTFSVLGLVVMAVTLVALPVSETVMGRIKGNETHYAYDVLLNELETRLSGPVGTVVSNESDVFGNILLYEPGIGFYNDNLVRAGHPVQAPAVLMWSGHGDVPGHLSAVARELGFTGNDSRVFRSSMPVNGNERTVDYSYIVREETDR
ncbi:glycosyltransferase family 39 protein [Nitratireductor sp. XY-223]|uniref:ArnT family glycosyltransferase n=1 Tax=Nitratireductor sp. XY-223 TaxID=2561926 RepID=UPI0010A99755|nr:glycosyltransferase family 39 protein [Nitratireductor sp. XY-223]